MIVNIYQQSKFITLEIDYKYFLERKGERKYFTLPAVSGKERKVKEKKQQQQQKQLRRNYSLRNRKSLY